MHSKLKESKSTRVFLVRHGQSTYNALGLYQGSSNESVLTEAGINDARLTGNYLRGFSFDAIYSSSLNRAYNTAEEILKVIAPLLSETIGVSDKLRETDMLAWQGLAFKYVRENFPQDYRTWKQRPQEFSMKVEGVSKVGDFFYPALDLYKRVQEFWQEILPRHLGQTLLLVTHGGTNRALISTATGIKPQHYHCIQQSNCGISILEFADGSLESGRLKAMNLTSHVGDNLPKLQQGNEGVNLLLVTSGDKLHEVHSITRIIRGINLDFSIIEHCNNSYYTAQQILQYHPTTRGMPVVSQEFLSVCEQKIANSNKKQLSTGLVVAEVETIARLIAQVLGKNLQEVDWLELQPGAISCIHYSSNEYPPQLQVMNLNLEESQKLTVKSYS